MQCMLKNWTSVLRGRFGPHNSIETDKGTPWIKSRHHRAPEPFFPERRRLRADRSQAFTHFAGKIDLINLISSLTNPELGCEGISLKRYMDHAVFSKESKFHLCVRRNIWTGYQLLLSCHLQCPSFGRSWTISGAGYFLKSMYNLFFPLAYGFFA